MCGGSGQYTMTIRSSERQMFLRNPETLHYSSCEPNEAPAEQQHQPMPQCIHFIPFVTIERLEITYF